MANLQLETPRQQQRISSCHEQHKRVPPKLSVEKITPPKREIVNLQELHLREPVHNTSGRMPPKPHQGLPAPPRVGTGSHSPPTRAPENQGWFPCQWKVLALTREEVIPGPGEAVAVDSILRQQNQLGSQPLRFLNLRSEQIEQNSQGLVTGWMMVQKFYYTLILTSEPPSLISWKIPNMKMTHLGNQHLKVAGNHLGWKYDCVSRERLSNHPT